MTIYTGVAPASMYADYLLDLNVKSQDVAANTTTLNYRIYLKSKGGGYPFSSAQHKLDFTADGRTIVSKNTSYKVPAGGEFTLASGTFTVAHGADGEKSFNFASAFASGHGSCSVSGSMTLPAIARGSTLSITNTSGSVLSSAEIGTTIRLKVNKSGSFTHRVGYQIGIDYGYATAQINYSDSLGYADFTIPSDWTSSYFANQSSKVVTFYVYTYNGGTKIAEDQRQITVLVPSSIVPSIASVSVSENNSSVSSVFGTGYYQNLSRYKFTISANGISGSTITNYNVEMDTRVSNSSSNIVNLDEISKTGSIVAKVTVTDSRGRKATQDITVQVLPYNMPSISRFTVQRMSGGVSAEARLIASHTSVSSPDKNPATIIVRIKKKTDINYTTVYDATSNVNDFNELILLGSNLGGYDAYDVEAVISDMFGSNKAVATLATSEITMAWNTTHNNIGVGMFSNMPGRNALEVKGQIRSHDIIRSLSSIKLPGKLTSSDHVNQVVVAGFYTVRSAMGLPDGAGKYGSLIVTKGDLTDAYNSFTDTIQTYLDGSAIYVRNTIDQTSTWTDWIKIGSSGITVSKYSNGYTIKYDDGYMEQVVTADLTSTEKAFTSGSAGFYGGKTKVIYFNDSFTSAPEAVANCYSSGYVQGFVGEAYTNRVNVRLYSPNSVAESNLSLARVVVHAKGFWE